MPTKAESLTGASSSEEVKNAISECIAQQLSEHPDMEQDQAAAICYSQARKTGANTGIGAKTSRRITGLGE